MVKLLHDNGAALTFTTAIKGRTALHLAAMSGNVQVARLLENDYPSPDVQVQLMRQLVLLITTITATTLLLLVLRLLS
jgi:ankyrin repeat protein